MEWLDFVLVVLAVVASFLLRNVGVVDVVRRALADGSLTNAERLQIVEALQKAEFASSSARS